MTETEPRVPSAESPTANMAQQETMRGGSQGKKRRPETEKEKRGSKETKRRKQREDKENSFKTKFPFLDTLIRKRKQVGRNEGGEREKGVRTGAFLLNSVILWNRSTFSMTPSI